MNEFEKRIKRLFEEAKKEARQADIPFSPNISSISVNKRAKKRLGCCKEIRKNGGGTYSIEISAFIEGMEDMLIKQVILHELLHTCKGCMNHGAKWKSYAEKLNREFGYNIKAAADYRLLGIEPEDKSYRYMITCRSCGAKGYRMRKTSIILHPENYRCRKCGGKLEISVRQNMTEKQKKQSK